MTILFFSYSHADSDLRDQLEKHLAVLKRQGRIEAWHDRKIVAGDPLDDRISEHLERADVVLMLLSSDFLASDYCYGIEMTRALERVGNGDARVIPIVLRPCDWKSTPLGKLLAAPTDGKPVTRWADRDEAWLSVVESIKSALPESYKSMRAARPDSTQSRASLERVAGPRSSNLRVRKEFTDADRSRFLKSAFEFISLYFDNSLKELESRNSEIGTEFTRIDAYHFTAVIYRYGKAVSQCSIRLNARSTGFGAGIVFSHEIAEHGNSFNESLSVEVDEQSLFLKALGMGGFSNHARETKLSQEGAAELYWSMLIERLQQ